MKRKRPAPKRTPPKQASPKPARPKRTTRKKIHHFILGQDFQSDGHTRITRGEDYLVQGGTEASHPETVDIVETFSTKLKKEGHPDFKVAVEILKDVLKQKGVDPASIRPDASRN
jgi:hypothetical protein